MATGLESGFRLGPWEVRPKLGTLSGPGGDVHLEPKVMGVLVCLVEQAGEVVTRDQFVERVWAGRIVSDEVLSRCISLLRTRLGDNPREPTLIQTVPKIGYRLIAPVEPLTSVTPPAADEMTTTPDAAGPAAGFAPSIRIVVPAALLVLAALAFLLVEGTGQNGQPPQRPERPSVVVLPFMNHSGDPDDEYFSDGLTEELIDRLARVEGLDVVASTSAFAFKERRGDVRDIARQLGVAYVLEGNVRKDDERVRITAQLIDAERGFHAWSEQYDTELRDIFGVQDEIARSIVVELQPRLSADTAQPAVARPTEVFPAYELLLQGRYHLKRREEAPIRRSIELFQQAIELDPGFGDAYRELARAYALLPNYSYEDREEMFALSEGTLESGVAHDPALAGTVHDVLAFLHYSRWEWIEAEQQFRRALAVAPNDPTVRQWYSQHLASVGKLSESQKHILEAKRLDVLSPVVNDRLAIAWLWLDDNENALRQFRLADELGMGPSANPEAYLVLLLREGDYIEAREILVDLQRLFARAVEWIDPFIEAQRHADALPAARDALARAARERQVSVKYLFGAWVYLGDSDAAMDAAFELLGEPGEFDVEFLFVTETAILRRHPRFAELLRAIGLDRYWDRYGWPAACARHGETIECR